ncbi:hypothetical protein GGR51DRAFT_566714 [Nemania sp. FL0031]|nr:hypothetical protein GGR51DRAFT_566714 [Nemania sp. FL0031]
MPNYLSLIGLSLLAAFPQAYAGNLLVYNACPFQIWCASAKNDASFSETIPVAAGGTYLSPKPAMNDNIGAVVKCALNPSLHPVYQLELAVKDGRSWLDLSHEDGSPFLGHHRHAQIDGSECTIDCQPGESNCDYPTSVDCFSQGDAVMTLCT